MITVPTRNQELIKSALGNSYNHIKIENILVRETFKEGELCNVELTLTNGKFLKGKGVGLVDATFKALQNYYSVEYESLKSIKLSKFEVKAKSEGMNAAVEVSLFIKNSFGNVFDFSDTTRSLTASAAHVTAATVEYFINSEKAYVAVHGALMDAKERNRQDLVTRYTSELALLVQSTSYTEVIERLQEQL